MSADRALVLDYGSFFGSVHHPMGERLSSILQADTAIVDYRDSFVDPYRSGCVLTYVDVRSHRANTLRTVSRDVVDLIFLRDGETFLTINNERTSFARGTVVVLFNADDVSIVKAAGSRKSGIHLKVAREALIDDYDLDPAVLPPHARAALLGHARQPVKLVFDLLPRAAMTLEDVYISSLKGRLFRRYVRAKTEDLVCQLIGAWNAQILTRSVASSAAVRLDEIVDAAAYTYRQRIGEALTVDDLSRSLGINKNRLTAGFRDRFGQTPAEYARVQGLQWAKEQLAARDRSVKVIATLSGYADISSFSRAFKAYFGVPPSRIARTSAPEWPREE